MALADFNQAIRFSPTLAVAVATAYDNRALAYERQGELVRAKADLDTELKLRPKDVYALRSRAEVYRRLRDRTHELADLNAAIALDPADPISLEYRGRIYAVMGDDARAIADDEAAQRARATPEGRRSRVRRDQPCSG